MGALLAEQMIEMKGLLGKCMDCGCSHRKDTPHRCPKNIQCPLKVLGICDCDTVLETGHVANHLETVHDVKSYTKLWHGYSCRFKIKFTRFTELENPGNGKHKMAILHLRKDLSANREFKVGDQVIREGPMGASHTGEIIGLARLHARVRCEDGNTCHFAVSQLSLKEPNMKTQPFSPSSARMIALLFSI